MAPDDDLADVEKVLTGEIGAFENIVRRWQSPLINLAYRFCRDRGRAEEMAQEAFLRAFRGLASWRRDAAFSTWLFALAANLYRTELRRIPVLLWPLDHAAQLGDPAAAHADMEIADRDDIVRRAVFALPPKYREPMILYYFHEMDIERTARSLSLPEGTVKARLSRGRDLLRGKLPRLLTGRLKEAL